MTSVSRHIRRRISAALLALLALSLHAASAHGHGMPVALAFWGDFPPAAAACQRAIGSAAAACAQKTWRLRRNCDVAVLRGGVCDEETVGRATQAARFAAQDAVAARCSETQVRLLQFLDVREAQLDVTTFCRQLVDATRSLLLDPVVGTALPPPAAACVDATTRGASKLFSAGFGSRQRVLDRIAVGSFAPARKLAMVDASADDIADIAVMLDGEIGQACSSELFGALYHQQSSSEVLSKLATRADCLAGQTYAQGGIVCPLKVCGNWMIEAGEDCDDGNATPGDGCDADCFFE